MLFGKRTRRPMAPMARPVTRSADHARGATAISNGLDTPATDVGAMRRALDHTAWHGPSVGRQKNEEIGAAIRVLERTAACVDMAQERLNEAAETLMLGQATTEHIMRGLLTARLEDLLNSLERVAAMAQDGHINLLSGGGKPSHNAKYGVVLRENCLGLDISAAGYSYVLTPIDIRRGRSGLDIPFLRLGFDNAAETFGVETAILRAQKCLEQFGERLSHDAAMLVKIAQANEVDSPIQSESVVVMDRSPANDLY